MCIFMARILHPITFCRIPELLTVCVNNILERTGSANCEKFRHHQRENLRSNDEERYSYGIVAQQYVV